MICFVDYGENCHWVKAAYVCLLGLDPPVTKATVALCFGWIVFTRLGELYQFPSFPFTSSQLICCTCSKPPSRNNCRKVPSRMQQYDVTRVGVEPRLHTCRKNGALTLSTRLIYIQRSRAIIAHM